MNPGAILITGASSGIGAALARLYARERRAMVLWGRDRERLEAVAVSCRGLGAEVRTRILDLEDPRAALGAALEDDATSPVELAVLSAGLGDMRPEGALTEDPERTIAVGLVNFVASTVLATALGRRMAARGHGRLVLIGSAAGFHALPLAPTYSGSKAGLARFADALSIALEPHGVDVLLVSPGFVDTPMSRRLASPKPFLLDVDVAAARIARAASRRRRHLVLPALFWWLRVGDRLLPWPLRRRILRGLRA